MISLPTPAEPAREPTRFALALTLVPLALVVLAYASSLRFGHFGDSRFLIEHNRFLRSWADLWPNAIHDYFWCSDGVSIPYWRPFTKLSWLVEWRLAGPRPTVHHVVQVAWFVGALAGAHAIARRLGASAVGASFAVLLAGLHPAAIEPVCLVMARSDVVAAAGVAWALAAWLSWASTGRRAWGVAHAVALVVALASKEVAVITAPLLTVWALCLERDRARLRALSLKLVPAWSLVALYLVGRRFALSDAAHSHLGVDPLQVFVGGARYLEALAPLRYESGIANLARTWAATPGMLARSAAAWAGFAALTAVAIRRRQVAWLMLLAWVAASVAPVLLVGSIQVPGAAGKIPLSDRWALQAVMASAVLWALLLEPLRARLRQGLYALGLAWAIGACVIAGSQRSYFSSEAAYVELEDEVYQAIPARFRTHDDVCRFFDRRITDALSHGRNEVAYQLSAAAMARCADDRVVRMNFVWSAVQVGRYAEARRALPGTLNDPNYTPHQRASLMQVGGLALLRDGAPREAWQLFQGARALGIRGCEIDRLAAEATALLGDAAVAERERERASRCPRP